MELGTTTVMTFGFRDREHILDLFESQSGVRMNHAYIRPGGSPRTSPTTSRPAARRC
jgi:NADH-quinone oxidoreductase subunit D